MKLNILIYHPNNLPAKDLEALTGALVKNSHNVFLVTQAKRGRLHHDIENAGGQADSIYVNDTVKLFYYIKQAYYLALYCKKKNIQIVYSNLQPCSIVSVFARFFIKSEFIFYRHHSDTVQIFGSLKERVTDWLINKAATHILVIDKRSYRQVNEVEKTPKGKIHRIQLGYDFMNFSVDKEKAENIRRQYDCRLLAIMVGSLTTGKRPSVAFEAVRILRDRNFDIKLLVLGTGPLEQVLRNYILEHNLMNTIFMPGFVNNVYEYLAASDILVHPSVSEASSHMPKEASLFSRPVAVCNDVGDFNEYILNEENGYLMNKMNPIQDLVSILQRGYNDNTQLIRTGKKLKETVLEKFSIHKIVKQHEELFNKLLNNKIDHETSVSS